MERCIVYIDIMERSYIQVTSDGSVQTLEHGTHDYRFAVS